MEAFEKVAISITSMALEGLEPFATAGTGVIHSASIIITNAKSCHADPSSFTWHKDASFGADPEVVYKADSQGRFVARLLQGLCEWGYDFITIVFLIKPYS